MACLSPPPVTDTRPSFSFLVFRSPQSFRASFLPPDQIANFHSPRLLMESRLFLSAVPVLCKFYPLFSELPFLFSPPTCLFVCSSPDYVSFLSPRSSWRPAAFCGFFPWPAFSDGVPVFYFPPPVTGPFFRLLAQRLEFYFDCSLVECFSLPRIHCM